MAVVKCVAWLWVAGGVRVAVADEVVDMALSPGGAHAVECFWGRH